MRIVIRNSVEEVDVAAAQEVARQTILKPASVLGLSTGNTTVGVHEAIVRLHRECGLSFAQATTFNVDEYAGVPPDHPASCRVRIFDQLLDRIDIRREKCHLPDGNAGDLEREAAGYEERIDAAGGIDLQILGVGMNGHIGFNEPGTPFETRCHIAEISSRSLSDKGEFYRRTGFHPVKAVTLGIRSIMNARIVLLIAKGTAKSGIMRKALFGPVTPDVPASVLQLHPNVMVLVDSSVLGHPDPA
jgi:glucosamine-6-phosphate deaminase